MQAGFHEFIPLDPGDTFALTQPRLFLVFALTTPPACWRQTDFISIGCGTSGARVAEHGDGGRYGRCGFKR